MMVLDTGKGATSGEVIIARFTESVFLLACVAGLAALSLSLSYIHLVSFTLLEIVLTILVVTTVKSYSDSQHATKCDKAYHQLTLQDGLRARDKLVRDRSWILATCFLLVGFNVIVYTVRYMLPLLWVIPLVVLKRAIYSWCH